MPTTEVTSYYNETLKTTPEALKYLEARGLKSSEIPDPSQRSNVTSIQPRN